jgi:hypothetical protein
MSKQTAVEWLEFEINKRGPKENNPPQWLEELYEQAKAMEREQQERTFSKEEVIAIVRKSRATGLTAEYLILALKRGEQ